MPSYLITGVSRGIGYEFLRQYSSDTNNIVVGLVRNKATTDKKVSEDPDLKGRSNIHIFAADITDYAGLQKAALETAKITGGSLDYIIANAGLVAPFDQYDGIGDLGSQPEQLTKELRDLFEVNVIGNIHLFNLFLPLIQKGQVRKVIAITSGYSDIELTRNWDMTLAPLYSASKAALNMIIAKFSAQFKKDGILFLALAPGTVDVGNHDTATPEQLQKSTAVFGELVPKYAPDFKGPLTPEQSVSLMRTVIVNASIEKGNAGDFVSQFGNKQWL
ncbi:NAD(P)-binding protein [Karstenula rhodostoma CBS 690.94]|uniref:NAD(P)-binding protein n=1 Tax=Karstenula rhodostoma CBS 690.94 TaxID=1392251 RepID=A0A9P4PEV3_9PLEO|nr:NAD(P)-binding protein [Karstenula rhodostoma CBS 690.94]